MGGVKAWAKSWAADAAQRVRGLAAPGKAALNEATLPGVQLLGDRLALETQGLKRLAQQGMSPGPEQAKVWRELAKALGSQGEGAFAQEQARLASEGWILARSSQGVIVQNPSGQSVMAQAELLRFHQADGRSDWFRQGQRVGGLRLEGAELVAEAPGPGGLARWEVHGPRALDAQGHPLTPPKLRLPPGEAARGPKPSLPEPIVLPNPGAFAGTVAEFQAAIDGAVTARGGRVLQGTRVVDTQEAYLIRMATEPNCHSHALTGGRGDLTDPSLAEGRMQWISSPLPQLLKQGYQELPPSVRVRPGDRVVYHLDGQMTHTGIVRAVDEGGWPSRVESKWGEYGVYEHPTWAVPDIYGQELKFYRPPEGR